MNQELFEKELDEIITTLAKTLKARALEIYRSGAIDKDWTEQSKKSFVPHRMLLCAALPDVEESVLMRSLLTPQQRKEIKNLEHF